MLNQIKKGMILKEFNTGKEHRIIFVNSDLVVLCEMYTTKLTLRSIPINVIIASIREKRAELIEMETVIIDENSLSPAVKNSYLQNKKVIEQICAYYGPVYLGLANRKQKPFLKKISDSFDITIKTIYRLIRLYLQSGMQDSSLLDGRNNPAPPASPVKYRIKTGRPAQLAQGKVLTEQDYKWFDEAIALKGKPNGKARGMTWRDCYNALLKHYETDSKGESIFDNYLPVIERPTFGQFYAYALKHANKKALDIAQTSQFEVFNDRRTQTGSSKTNLAGPGDVFEIDACEVDTALVSSMNNYQGVGRAILYVVVDVWTNLIIGVSVALDNNSVVGCTNAIANLIEDKHEFAGRYGVTFDDDRLWPTGFKPNSLRVDHGSDFISSDLLRICQELGIDRDIVPIMCGSMKGTVEHIFCTIHQKTGVPLVMKGTIQKRYDSKHHKQAVATIEDFIEIVLTEVLYHNAHYIPTRDKSSDEIENHIPSIPAALWEYGCEKFNNPRELPSKDEFFWHLLIPAKAKTSSDTPGLDVDGLIYDCDSKRVLDARYKTQRTKIYYDIRYDPRCTDYIYLLEDSKLKACPLNNRIPSNISYAGMTWKKYKALQKSGRYMNAEYNDYQTLLSKETSDAIQKVVDKAEARRVPGVKNNTKNMREARAEEKERVSVQNGFANRYGLAGGTEAPSSANALPEPKYETPQTTTEKLSLEEQKALSEAAALEYLYED